MKHVLSAGLSLATGLLGGAAMAAVFFFSTAICSFFGFPMDTTPFLITSVIFGALIAGISMLLAHFSERRA